ncbi:MAG: triose-phosphate isomerase [Bacteroidetes bacterium]|nr:triose-phosphate isomerase [Bacteroidota bacterium]
MKRQKIVAGNWKMNLNFQEGRDLASEIIRSMGPTEVLAILCPPFVHLNHLSVLANGVSNLEIGAQNCHQVASGAYTGEVSASMIKSVGANFVIIGHSERREFFNESDNLLAEKVNVVLQNDLRPIFCCGEKLDIREAGSHEALVGSQLENGLFHLDSEAFSKVVIAYEPVWAIGTGKTASPAQAQEMHQFIRSLIAKKYGSEIAEATTILYGGSCKPDNASEIFSQPDVDGGLIGGASLKAKDFVAILGSFPKQ